MQTLQYYLLVLTILCVTYFLTPITMRDPQTSNMRHISHTRTVVRKCFKGDEASQWKRPKFDPSPHQNPLTDLHQNWQA